MLLRLILNSSSSEPSPVELSQDDADGARSSVPSVITNSLAQQPRCGALLARLSGLYLVQFGARDLLRRPGGHGPADEAPLDVPLARLCEQPGPRDAPPQEQEQGRQRSTGRPSRRRWAA